MIGCYDFCGHYEWTFAWLERAGGDALVQAYWAEAIGGDAQTHASDLIVPHGIDGMRRYWQHTLEEEAAGFGFTSDENCFRIDMRACPSKGFLVQNGLEQYSDYCDHCLGWIGPVMQKAGFVVDHEHNHCGQCWWEFRRVDDQTKPSACGDFAGAKDVRSLPFWSNGSIENFNRATSVPPKEHREG